MALLNAPEAPSESRTHDKFGRAIYHHPALDTLTNLTPETKAHAVDKKRLAQLADQYGIREIIRWKPKNVRIPGPLADRYLRHWLGQQPFRGGN
jgi:hypothetical protein